MKERERERADENDCKRSLGRDNSVVRERENALASGERRIESEILRENFRGELIPTARDKVIEGRKNTT